MNCVSRNHDGKACWTSVRPNTAFSYLFYGKRTNVVWSKGLSVNSRGPRQRPEKKRAKESECVRACEWCVRVHGVGAHLKKYKCCSSSCVTYKLISIELYVFH